MLLTLRNEILSKSYDGILVSTTSKKSNKISILPNKVIKGKKYINILITNTTIAEEVFKIVDGKLDIILIDVERKKSINLMGLAYKIIKKSCILPYKPNDITLEAADQLVLQQTKHDLIAKNIIIYGTGNLGFKLALRLIEREANVHLVGRNIQKVNSLIESLNRVKPKFSKAYAMQYKPEDGIRYDGLVSFVSADKVINDDFANCIKSEGFAIDGGIGNFSEDFIALCLNKRIFVTRLDVRLGNEFLAASISSLNKKNVFFNEIMGSTKLNNQTVVAGGIIGPAGSIIVDRIKEATQIIGIANGYGGLKNESEYTKSDRENLQDAKKTLL